MTLQYRADLLKYYVLKPYWKLSKILKEIYCTKILWFITQNKSINENISEKYFLI